MTYTRAEIATALREALRGRRHYRGFVFLIQDESRCAEEYARALDRWRLRAKDTRRSA